VSKSINEDKEDKFHQEDILIVDTARIIEELGEVNGSLFITYLFNVGIGEDSIIHTSRRMLFFDKTKIKTFHELPDAPLKLLAEYEAILTWNDVLRCELETFKYMKTHKLHNLPVF
jgi:hypothetical protein